MHHELAVRNGSTHTHTHTGGRTKSTAVRGAGRFRAVPLNSKRHASGDD